MRRSRILAKLRAGEVVTCTKLNTSDPRVAEIAAMSGFDSLWICMEHVPNTLHDVENQVRAAKMYDVDTIVRVPRGCYSDLIRPLEMDAAGIMIPHVMSADEARAIVRQTRFAPLGLRPLDGGNSDGAFTTIPGPEYMQQANHGRVVIVQIEDPEAMTQLDEIAAVEGIDMLLFGPGDFSQAIGAPYQLDHPEIADASRRVVDAARRHGKFAGTIADLNTYQRRVDEGYRFVSVSADVVLLAEGFARIAAAIGGTPAPAVERGDIYTGHIPGGP